MAAFDLTTGGRFCLTADNRYRLLEKAKYCCSDCGGSPKTGDVRLHLHHSVVPVRRGGGNDDENLVVLCAACHAGVHATDPGSVKDELLNPGAETLYPIRQEPVQAR